MLAQVVGIMLHRAISADLVGHSCIVGTCPCGRPWGGGWLCAAVPVDWTCTPTYSQPQPHHPATDAAYSAKHRCPSYVSSPSQQRYSGLFHRESRPPGLSQ